MVEWTIEGDRLNEVMKPPCHVPIATAFATFPTARTQKERHR